MYDVVKIKYKDGYYLFKLGKVLKENNITMNKIIDDLGIEYIVIKRLSTGNLQRIDLYVISRICNYLNCSMSDIVEYVPL